MDLATLTKLAAVKACRYGYLFSAVGNLSFFFFSELLRTVPAKPQNGSLFQFVTVAGCYFNDQLTC